MKRGNKTRDSKKNSSKSTYLKTIKNTEKKERENISRFSRKQKFSHKIVVVF